MEQQVACAPRVASPRAQDLEVVVAEASVFVRPQVLSVGPIAVATRGTILEPVEVEGDWYLIRFQDRRFGERFGYVHCAEVSVSAPVTAPIELPALAPTAAPSVSIKHPVASGPPSAPTISAAKGARPESRSGYLEWRRDGFLIVDGQRIRWHNQTRVRAEGITSMDAIPIGYEISFRGTRLTDGSILAEYIEAKPNGTALLESEVRTVSDRAEEVWTTEGALFLMADDQRRTVGRVVGEGPEVDRARRIVARLVPSYLPASGLRVRLVDSPQWNAMVMANGSIWAYKGLMNEVDDDELAAVLGHELAHFTHEHVRRDARNSFWLQLANAVAGAAITQIDSPSAATAASIARLLSVSAWENGYSRDLEDQADRVGLRYAYEAGFDISKAPKMWERRLQRDGEMDRVSNFLFGSHSRPSDRIRNLNIELRQNYSLVVRD